ncbi:MAG: late competence protein required for DNA uptake (superfamily II DNA/RNA helicase) [Rhodothermales bacterium]|jgi:late competence protein required for DNA uptake (superfamily II DNA/RNA helicase)
MQIAQARCYNHAVREAAARCPECSEFFCRECITEHESRVICASCFEKSTVPEEKKKCMPWIGDLVAFTAGFWLIWICVYSCGRLLASIPSSWHVE